MANPFIMKTQPLAKCKKCVNSVIQDDLTNGNAVCTGCGLVLEDIRISDEAEWRNFSPDVSGACQDKSRVGYGKDLFTTISSKGQSNQVHGTDTQESGSIRSIQTMQRLQQRSQVRGVKGKIAQAYQEIETLCDNFELNQSVKMESRKVAEQAFTENWISRIDDNFITSAACVLIGTRQQGFPRQPTEFCSHFKLNIQDVTKVIKVICKDLRLRKYNYDGDLRRYGKLARMDHIQIEQATAILPTISDMSTLSHKPIYLVAMALFFASKRTDDIKKTITRVTKLSPPAFNRLYEDISHSDEYKEMMARKEGIL